jgi:Mn-dependent DtxR family transcriptional regulator
VSVAQERVLAALAVARQPLTVKAVAARVAGDTTHVQHTLDALYRRSLVTVHYDGRWTVTERGERKAAA